MKQVGRHSVCGWLAALTAAALPALGLADDQASAPQTTPYRAAPLFSPQAGMDRTSGKILFLPFVPLNPSDPQPWLGASVQKSLLAGLMVDSPNRVSGSDEAAATVDQAVAIGRRNAAAFVVMGSFTSSNEGLRLTGQIIDVKAGKPIAGLMVTGAADQIFRMEDGLAMQVKAALMPDLFARDQQAAQANDASQPSLTQPVPGEGSGDVGALSPSSAYISIYANPPQNYAADYNRFYSSSPDSVYSYNTYTALPSAYSSGPWSYPYFYPSPFVGGAFGPAYGGQFGRRDWRDGHRDERFAGRGADGDRWAPRGATITGSTGVDYSGIVSGNVPSTYYRRPGTANVSNIPERGSISITRSDGPGVVRAGSTVIRTSPDLPPAQRPNFAGRDPHDASYRGRVVDIGGSPTASGGFEGGFSGGDSGPGASGGRPIGVPAFGGAGSYSGPASGALPSFAPSVPAATPPSIYAGHSSGRYNGANNGGGRR